MSTRQFLTATLPPPRVEPELKEAVERLAKKEDRTVSAIQRRALWLYVRGAEAAKGAG